MTVSALSYPNEPAPRRNPRRTRPVEVASFTGDVDEALHAFATDVSYAVQMARCAVTIGRKRDVWAARRDQRL